MQRLNSFVSKTQQQQIEKVKILNNISSSSEFDETLKKKEDSNYLKVDTIEQISITKGYKPTYYLSLDEENHELKEEQRSETEIFEEERVNIKKNIMGSKISDEDLKKEPNIWENKTTKNSSKYKNDDGIYLRDMIRFSMKKNEIARSFSLFLKKKINKTITFQLQWIKCLIKSLNLH